MCILLQICLCFVMRETSCCLFVTILFNQADLYETFNSTSRYLDDLLNIDNPYFEKMISQIYHTELKLKRQNPFILQHLFWT